MRGSTGLDATRPAGENPPSARHGAADPAAGATIELAARGLDSASFLLVIWSVSMSVTAQSLLRHGMRELSGLSGSDLALAAIATPAVLTGLAAYLLGTASWLVVLSRIDLAVAYPLASLNFVLVTLAAAFVLDETVPPLRWAGTAFILVGILVMAGGERARGRGATAGPESRSS